jgi:hypothetical protein
MTTVIVSSAIANKPLNGGNAWVVLSWVRGLQRLGCQVHFVEQLAPQNCVDAAGQPVGLMESINLQFFKQVTGRFGLGDSATLIYDEGTRTHGLTMAELCDLADATDLLVNITGHLTLERLKARIKRKAYVDLDPGYTQYWQASGNDGAHLEGHDLYFTVGENVGTDRCSIPTGGIAWKPIRPPVVLEDWPCAEQPAADRFTTIASWRGAYGRVQWEKRLFGQKAHEFRKFMNLPRQCPQPFEIALDIHADDARDRRALLDCGWHLVDPRSVAADPASFREYVQSSRAEFSVAQGIYVETDSGWFSDRTVRYLASGKPALMQDTGLNRLYAAAGGLVLFRTLEQAIAGAEQIARDYTHHCRAARAIAEEYFDSRRVLTGLLEQVGLAG